MQSTLTPEQIQTIQLTIPALKDHGTTITQSMYRGLLTDYPQLKNIFNRTNQQNLHQSASLASVLLAYASNIDNLIVLTAALERINHKHASLFIQPEQYDLVGKYLLKAISDVLGDALTNDMLDAWAAAYGQLASFMIERERRLLQKEDIGEWNGWRDFEIVDKVEESEEITSFYLRPRQLKNGTHQNGSNGHVTSPLPTYRPGQYISVQVEVPELGYRQSRQYSLSDAYKPDTYRISVKREVSLDVPNGSKSRTAHGTVSNTLHSGKHIGDIVEVSPPHGDFHLQDSNRNQPIVLLAAGVGITPMMSMLRTACSRPLEQPITLIHGAHSTKTRAFYSDVKTFAEANINLQYASFITTPNSTTDILGRDYDFAGRIQLDRMDAKWLFVDENTTEYYICGPESFMADMEKELKANGVEKSRIHMEVFGATIV